MMNYIFAGMVLFSFVFAALTGRMDKLSEAAMTQAGQAVTLLLSLMGMMCMWNGLMRVAQASGLTKHLSRLLSPVTRRLFHGLDPDGEAVSAATMNLVANFLGLGNAATPLGIKAVCAMEKEQRANGRATDAMAMFIVLNTASIQLIPATTAMLRVQAGASVPLDILPATWLASGVSLAAGIAAAMLLIIGLRNAKGKQLQVTLAVSDIKKQAEAGNRFTPDTLPANAPHADFVKATDEMNRRLKDLNLDAPEIEELEDPAPKTTEAPKPTENAAVEAEAPAEPEEQRKTEPAEEAPADPEAEPAAETQAEKTAPEEK